MNNYLFVFFILLSAFTLAQNAPENYNVDLARELQADDYGMKSYILVILQTGNQTVTDEAKKNELFKGHQENIRKLAEEGKLVVAGPFMQNDLAYRGLFILNTSSIEEAKLMLEKDPTVNAGIFNAVYLPWYGSAALSAYLPVHAQIEKIKP